MPEAPPSRVRTLCPYCGVGCGLTASPTSADGAGWRTAGDPEHPSSRGLLCVKGTTVAESLDRDRLTHPMVRDRLDEPFRRVSWEAALERVSGGLRHALATRGADGVAVYGSGQLQTEDYYAGQKLVRAVLGSNHFDANSRLCMASAVAGYVDTFGADGPPPCYEDLDHADVVFLLGTNLADCHPVLFHRLLRRRRREGGPRLVVIDPRRTRTAEAADLHLGLTPGSDIDLLTGMAHLLWRDGRLDRRFIAEHTRGFERLAATLPTVSPGRIARRCRLGVEELVAAARAWGEGARVLSLWSMGLNQSSEGTAKVRALLDLHLMTGQVGRPGAGPLSLTGQPNAMGGRESGGLAHLLPGYRSVTEPQHRAEVERAWGLEAGSLSSRPGYTALDLPAALEAGKLGALWIVATNPAVSLPDLARARCALAGAPLTIVQDAYFPTETAELAHVVLPAAAWGEKTGTMTSSERMVTLCPAFREPPGEARADWEIFAAVGRRLGHGALLPWSSPAEVFAELAALTRDRPCEMTGLDHAVLAAGARRWPCRDSGLRRPGEPERLYGDHRFATPDGRARFAAPLAAGLAEPPDARYPLVLVTGRLPGHWHTLTRTGRIERLRRMHPEPYVELHPEDAARLGVEEGARLEVRSRRGRMLLPARLGDGVPPGVVFVPMHWGRLWAADAEVNALTHATACPRSGQPELKACAVALEPVRAAARAERSAETVGHELG